LYHDHYPHSTANSPPYEIAKVLRENSDYFNKRRANAKNRFDLAQLQHKEIHT
ncbi:unnamed protein product, partial [marine sediment metagenome]